MRAMRSTGCGPGSPQPARRPRAPVRHPAGTRRSAGLAQRVLRLAEQRAGARHHARIAEQAQHLGKGILERDLEKRFPDPDAEIIMYCGGGFRSALSCDAAQRMGYRNVASLIGGYKGLVAAGWPMEKAG